MLYFIGNQILVIIQQTLIMLAMTTMTNAQNVQNKAAENSTLQLVSERSGKCLFFYVDLTFLR